MKTKIENIDQLREQIIRLSGEKLVKEEMLKARVKDFSQQLKPVNLIKNAFNSIKGDSELKSQLASKGTEAALGFIVTNLLFKNSNPVIRTAATVLGTAFASKVFGEDSSKYIEKIKGLFEKFKKKSGEGENKEFDEEDIYRS